MITTKNFKTLNVYLWIGRTFELSLVHQVQNVTITCFKTLGLIPSMYRDFKANSSPMLLNKSFVRQKCGTYLVHLLSYSPHQHIGADSAYLSEIPNIYVEKIIKVIKYCTICVIVYTSRKCFSFIFTKCQQFFYLRALNTNIHKYSPLMKICFKSTHKRVNLSIYPSISVDWRYSLSVQPELIFLANKLQKHKFIINQIIVDFILDDEIKYYTKKFPGFLYLLNTCQ